MVSAINGNMAIKSITNYVWTFIYKNLGLITLFILRA